MPISIAGPARAATALATALAVLLPPVGLATPAQAQERIRLCEDLQTRPPCPEGERRRGRAYIVGEDGSLTPARGGEDEPAPEAEAEAPAAEPVEETPPEEAEEAPAVEPVEDEAAAQAEAEAAAEAEAQAQAEAEAQAAEQAAAEQAAAEQAAAEQAAAEQAAAEQAAAEAQADAEAQAQAEEQAQSEAQAAEQAAAEAQAAEQAAAEREAAEQAAAEQAAAEADAQARAEAEAEAEAQAQADVEAEAPAVEEVPDEAPAPEEAPAVEEVAEEPAAPAEPEVTEADIQAALEAAVRERRAAERGDPTVEEEAEAPAAAAAEEEAPASVEEEVETVRADDVRSSDEDFANDVDEPAPVEEQPEEQASNDDDDDDGLSNFEKALLIGLGAVAVGTVLDNGDEIVANTGDRVVTRRANGDVVVYRDDDALLRQEGAEVRTQTFDDGSTRTVIERPNGVRIVTIRDAEGRVLRRARVLPDGTQIVLLDDTDAPSEPVDVQQLEEAAPAPVTVAASGADRATLEDLIAQGLIFDPGRTFSLRQVREIEAVRNLVPAIDLSTITFPTGSAAIPAEQVTALVDLGLLIEQTIDARPGEVFLIEGHTDAVGSDVSNLALSDRRAETVALALTENFDIPPENLVVQGYGEAFLKVPTEAAEQQNRRATVRRITPLLEG